MRRREITDLLVAWTALSIAFGNLFGGFTLYSLGIAAVTAGIGFLLHELAHRIVARNYGLSAAFEADYAMLFFAVLGSFAGFIFAAPGAVVTTGKRTGDQQALISAAGPITNIVLALAFLVVPGTVGNYGFRINSWLALFNMIPFAGLDGQAVFGQNKLLFAGIVLTSIGLVFFL